MSNQRFDFWAGVARLAVVGVTLLSALTAFGLMAADKGINLSIPWLTQ
jgi:hypothetical protein